MLDSFRVFWTERQIKLTLSRLWQWQGNRLIQRQWGFYTLHRSDELKLTINGRLSTSSRIAGPQVVNERLVLAIASNIVQGARVGARVEAPGITIAVLLEEERCQ